MKKIDKHILLFFSFFAVSIFQGTNILGADNYTFSQFLKDIRTEGLTRDLIIACHNFEKPETRRAKIWSKMPLVKTSYIERRMNHIKSLIAEKADVNMGMPQFGHKDSALVLAERSLNPNLISCLLVR